MHRFYVERPAAAGEKAVLSPEESAHAARVLRLRPGEEIVLLETALARPRCKVFTLQFAAGEFDMVVFDPECGSCAIYEIKHSDQAVAAQARHLVDPKKAELTEHHYGPIAERCVIYRGEDRTVDIDGVAVRYRNVEQYLVSLGQNAT